MHDAPEDGKSQNSLPNTRITVNKEATFRCLVDQYLSLIGPFNKINGISHFQWIQQLYLSKLINY